MKTDYGRPFLLKLWIVWVVLVAGIVFMNHRDHENAGPATPAGESAPDHR